MPRAPIDAAKTEPQRQPAPAPEPEPELLESLSNTDAGAKMLLMNFYRAKHPEYANADKISRIVDSFKTKAAKPNSTGQWYELMWAAYTKEGVDPRQESRCTGEVYSVKEHTGGSTYERPTAPVLKVRRVKTLKEKMEELKKKSEAGQCGGAAARVQDPIRDAEAAWWAGNAALERGASEAALELYETAAAGYAAAGDAANAAGMRKNGGIALQRQGKHAEARPRLEAAVAALTELLGPANVRTLQARQALGNGMLSQGELGAARVELEAVAAGLEAALGSAHTSTLAVRDSLAILLERAGDHAAAAAAFGQVVTAQTQARGARQPNMSELMSQAKWARNLTLSGRAAEALPLLEEAAPALAAKLGADHEYAVFAQRELAFARGRLTASSKKVGLLARLFGGKKSKPKVNARRETTENLLQSKGGMLDGLKPGEAVPSKAAEELCEEQGEYTNNPLCQLL